jgi:hypothetical protein
MKVIEVVVEDQDLPMLPSNMPSLEENTTNDFVKKFAPWVAEQLDIEQLPEIKLLDKPIDKTFGMYVPEDRCIYLVTGGRHPVDVLRTLAHELTHFKQDTQGNLPPGAGETGTDQENEANSEAGVAMRDFAENNPEYFGLSENMRRSAGVKKGDTIDYADLMRLHGRATEMKKSTNRATRERGVKMARQVTWFKNFHKRKSQAAGS